jgi:transposase
MKVKNKLKNKLKSYDKEFKLSTVNLYLNSGRSVRQLSNELGIAQSTLSEWVKEYRLSGKEGFPGKGHVRPCDEELIKLRKELAIVKEERDILKKAVGIFSLSRK